MTKLIAEERLSFLSIGSVSKCPAVTSTRPCSRWGSDFNMPRRVVEWCPNAGGRSLSNPNGDAQPRNAKTRRPSNKHENGRKASAKGSAAKKVRSAGANPGDDGGNAADKCSDTYLGQPARLAGHSEMPASPGWPLRALNFLRPLDFLRLGGAAKHYSAGPTGAPTGGGAPAPGAPPSPGPAGPGPPGIPGSLPG
ncbi:hypothetical protein Q31a_10660 [Aureliella helgolandensis]|uniref:Uncharacterized protein n=1 Tax=Aureliella helgolandensis TaxID=2527968 RepID=A0A518G2J4_9BACT|nr:hypothetical protein Q31a_10660 [Aureliella helgolandensis]